MSSILNGVSDPAVDFGLIPSGAMDADLDLTGERAFSDFAIEGRAREAGAGENCRQAKDAVGGIHGDGLPFGDGQWLPLG